MHRIKHWIKIVKSVKFELKLWFVVSFMSVILIKFWLIEIPEFFNGGYKIGQIWSDLCFSYISAFIFYFIVVHVKEFTDKVNLYRYISRFTNAIISQAKKLANDLSSDSMVMLKSDYPTKDELSSICTIINPNRESPKFIGVTLSDFYPIWMQYFENNRKIIIEYADRILSRNLIYDSELIKILAEICDCKFFNIVHHSESNRPSTNRYSKTNLLFIEDPMYDFFSLIKSLECYHNMEFKDFYK